MQRRGDASKVKLARIQKMHQMLHGAGDVDLDLFQANCEYQMGLNPETTLRYLRTLEKLGFIEIGKDTNLIREVANPVS